MCLLSEQGDSWPGTLCLPPRTGNIVALPSVAGTVSSDVTLPHETTGVSSPEQAEWPTAVTAHTHAVPSCGRFLPLWLRELHQGSSYPFFF